MYKFFKDKKAISKIYQISSNITNELKTKVNSEDKINLDVSYINNLVTREQENPIELDCNLIIYKFPNEGIDPKVTKDYLIEKLTHILKKYEYFELKDSVSLIEIIFKENKELEIPSFKLNICIILDILNDANRLVHKYNKKLNRDKYSWNKMTSLEEINKKTDILKEAELYEEVRNLYLEKKNMFFSRNELENHPSFLCFVEALNELFNTYVNKI